ncbi:MAG: GGDEF domain-containing protein [Xanthomonadales bacterium]|nr:GGDEF domain-containing protein [Xanthomonadales bacterium]
MAGRPERSARLLAGDEFDRAIQVWFLGVAAAALGVFGLIRALRGELAMAAADGILCALIALVAVAARRAADVERFGAVSAAVCTLGCLLGSLVIGRTALYWAIVVIWVSFLVVRPRWALPIVVSFAAGMALVPELHQDELERFSFLVAAGLSIVFGALFSARYRLQRETLALLVSFDALTGASSRRLFELGARRPLADVAVLAILDLDRFKEANDTLGHEAGDRLLAALGRTVRARLRQSDGFFRYGGDEFVQVLERTGLPDALPVLEDLRRRVAEALAGEGWPCTLSIGAAGMAPGESWADAFPRADAALRRAEEAGRDRAAAGANQP